MSVPAVVPAAPTVLNLVNLKKRRLQLDEELKNVEKQIYDLEEAYIEETILYGNIVRGWSEYVTYRPKSNVKKTKVSNRDRIFSYSSITSPTGVKLPGGATTAEFEFDDDDAPVNKRR